MERQLNIGDPVIFVDSTRVAHHALVTCVFDPSATWGEKDGKPLPGCNILYVHEDPARDDPYGRQIERETSVVHQSWQPGGGNYWCWPDEWDEPVKVG